MNIHIELGPDEERALTQRARGSGRELTEYVHQILQEHIRATAEDERGTAIPSTPDDLIDYEAIASCARAIQGQAVPSLDEVRRALATIPGSISSCANLGRFSPSRA